jgi:hypothetical protein
MANRQSSRTFTSASWIVVAVAGFAGTFFMIDQALAFLGVALSEADGAGFVAGLSIAGLIIVSHKLRASRRS